MRDSLHSRVCSVPRLTHTLLSSCSVPCCALLLPPADALTQPQIEMLARLDDVRSTTAAHVRKVDEKRTFELLNTAAQGDLESLRTMLGQGINANTADYDGRTALMLSAAKGHLVCGVVGRILGAFLDARTAPKFCRWYRMVCVGSS